MEQSPLDDNAIVVEEPLAQQHPDNNHQQGGNVARNQSNLERSENLIQLVVSSSVNRKDSMDDEFPYILFCLSDYHTDLLCFS